MGCLSHVIIVALTILNYQIVAQTWGGYVAGVFGGFANLYGHANQLRVELVTTQVNIRMQIITVNKTIQNDIATAKSLLDTKILDLNNETQNPNCKQIITDALKPCEMAPQFQAVNDKIRILSRLHIKIQDFRKFCSYWADRNEDKCTQEFSNIRKQIVELSTEIFQDIDNVGIDSKKCITEAQNCNST